MKYAILSDLHANRDALDRVLADVAACGADTVVCLGDIVGYGPLPKETLERVRSSAAVVIAGNHDDAVSGRTSASDFIDLAGDAVIRHRDALTREDLNWLKALPHSASIDGATLVHGDLTDPAAFYYIDSEDAAKANFEATDATLVFAGHTHVPGIYLTGQSGKVYSLGMEDFVIEQGKRYIVNVGSVGYPRESNGQCQSTYVLYDSEEKSVRFRSIPFAVSSVLQRGRDNRRRRRLVLSITALVLLAGGLTAGYLTSQTQAEDDRPPPTAERAVALGTAARTVRANMKLQSDSPKALLTIAFFDAEGRELAPVMLTAKSSTKKFPAPAGAVRATFSIRPIEAGATPKIQEFNPVAE